MSCAAVSGCADLAKRVALAPLHLLQKICQVIYQLAMKIIHYVFPSQTLAYFGKTFSYAAVFKTDLVQINGEMVDRNIRILRYDGEPDDCLNWMKTLFALNHSLTKELPPRLDVIVSEGDADALALKIDTLKNIACRLVADGVIEQRILDEIHFYQANPTDPGRAKVQGYNNIHQASDKLITDDVEKIKNHSCYGQAENVEVLHRLILQRKAALETAGSSIKLFELSFAPVDGGLLQFYEENPDLKQSVTCCCYGSYNFVKAIDRLGDEKDAEKRQAAAGRIETVFNGFEAVFPYEAFLATGHTRDGKHLEFNKLGSQTTPEIMAPLMAQDRSALQTFMVECYQGWNEPFLNKTKSYFTTEHDDKGTEFVKALEDKIQEKGASFTLHDAFELYPNYFTPKDRKKTGDKIKLLYSILVNKVQGTISDGTVSLVMASPDLLCPIACSTNQSLRFEKDPKGERINTVFSDKKGPVFAVQTVESPWKGEFPGIDIGKLSQRLTEFFASLKPAAQESSRIEPARVALVPSAT